MGLRHLHPCPPCPVKQAPGLGAWHPSPAQPLESAPASPVQVPGAPDGRTPGRRSPSPQPPVLGCSHALTSACPGPSSYTSSLSTPDPGHCPSLSGCCVRAPSPAVVWGPPVTPGSPAQSPNLHGSRRQMREGARSKSRVPVDIVPTWPQRPSNQSLRRSCGWLAWCPPPLHATWSPSPPPTPRGAQPPPYLQTGLSPRQPATLASSQQTGRVTPH